MTALTRTDTLSREITSLCRYVHDDDAKIDPSHRLDERNQNDQARALDLVKTTEHENDAAFVLFENLERVVCE